MGFRTLVGKKYASLKKIINTFFEKKTGKKKNAKDRKALR
jgi:hypothetical protein